MAAVVVGDTKALHRDIGEVATSSLGCSTSPLIYNLYLLNVSLGSVKYHF